MKKINSITPVFQLIFLLLIFLYFIFQNPLKIYAAPPSAPVGYHWVMTWNDEFNGTALDATKWEAQGDFGRREGWWCKKNAYVQNGNLVIATTNDGGGKYCSGSVDTMDLYNHRFGYYESSVKYPPPASQLGHWGGVWTFSDGVQDIVDSGQDGTEMDIIEYWPWVTNEKAFTHTLHWNGYEAYEQQAGAYYVPKSQVNLDDGNYHILGMWWRPDIYKFYADNVQTWRHDGGGVSQVGERILISDEIEAALTESKITDAVLPAQTLYDYVRVYDLVPDNGVYADIKYVSSSSADTGGPAKILTLQRPANTAVDNIMLAFITVDVAGNWVTPPSGWSAVARNDANGISTIIYYKVVSRTERASSYTWQLNEWNAINYEASGVIITYSGIDTDNPVDTKGKSSGSGIVATNPGVATTLANDLLIYYVGVPGRSTASIPSGWVSRPSVSSNNLTSSITFDKAAPAVGLTGSVSTTLTGASSNANTVIALKPAFLPKVTPTPAPVNRGMVTFKSSSSANANNSSVALTINKPASVSSGDFLVAYLIVRDAENNINPPVGWTKIGREDTGDYEVFSDSMSAFTFYKIAGPSEPSSYTFTYYPVNAAYGNTTDSSGVIAVYGGVDTNDPLEKYYVYGEPVYSITNMNSYTTDVYNVGMLTDTANDQLLFFVGVTAASTVTPPAGMTSRLAVANESLSNVNLFDKALTLAGDTGVIKTAQSVALKYSMTTLLAIKPAPLSGNPTPTPTIPLKIGDINGDGKVNIEDAKILLSDYASNASRSDLNHDNKVNLIDMGILLLNFGK